MVYYYVHALYHLIRVYRELNYIIHVKCLAQKLVYRNTKNSSALQQANKTRINVKAET